MKKIICMLLVIFLLVGCNSTLFFSEVKLEKSSPNLQPFINEAQQKNGLNLYIDGEKKLYVFLNEAQGIDINKFHVKGVQDTLYIYIDQESSNTSKSQWLYKINLNKKYERIKAIQNGKEISFNVISGK